MAYEQIKNSTLPRVLSEIVGDLADLFQKEMRLARAEITSNITSTIHAGVWMGAAAVLGLFAVMCALAALIFGIASFGIALHWSCLIVAAVLAIAAAGAFAKGKSDAADEIVPTRTLHQLNKDIQTTKDHLS